MSGKVQFNLKNVHYAILNETEDIPTWETPVAIPGAVTLTMEAAGETKAFYADGIVYYQSTSNNGYAGDLEVAKIPDKMMEDVWGMETDEQSKVMIERASVEPKPFALLYQIDGDAGNDYYTLYRCFGTRPGIGGKTNTETKEPQTQKTTISAVPVMAPETSDLDAIVKARTTKDTQSTVRTNWFKSVWTPGTGA